MRSHSINNDKFNKIWNKVQTDEALPKRYQSLDIQSKLLPQVRRELFELMDLDAQKNILEGTKFQMPKPSSASTAFVTQKNRQTTDIIKLISNNAFSQKRQSQIQECIRVFGIDNRHVNDLKRAFMDTELDHNGDSTTGQLIEKMKEFNIRYPKIILNFFINILNARDVFE